ncbi:MAG TPA: TolC family protein, partial [Candidatus Synoicihabitans sp.]|nr:TolC family protein [Candidatus Synoicihabitans sp.]
MERILHFPTFILWSAGLLASLAPAGAEESSPALTLDQVVAEIMATHPERAFYEAEIEAAQAQRRVAATRDRPELSLEGGRLRAHDARGIVTGEGWSWSVSVAQTFEWPGRLALRKSIANRQLDLAELGFARFQVALAARARVLAYGLYAAAQKAAATREVAERYQALREGFVARDPAGLTPLLETRVIEAQELALKRRAAEASLAHQAARVELNALRGGTLSAPLVITAPPLEFPDVIDPAALHAAARDRNFEYRIRQVELAQQGLEVSLARHERYPAFTLSPFYSREEANERETTVGLGLSIPLPNPARGRATVGMAEARQRQAEAALLMAQRELERDVVLAHHDYVVQVAEIRSWAPEAAEKFREAAALADRHFRLGAVPIGTYVELQEAYLDAIDALLDLQLAALEAGARL